MKKSKKLLFLFILLFLVSGCTKQLKDADGKPVKSKETNQVLVENVLCKPDELKNEYIKAIEEKRNAYKEKFDAGDLAKNKYKENISNLLDVEDLTACKDISIVEGGYETLWTSVFVKPLAWVIVNVGKLLGNNFGLSIIVVTIVIKLLLLPSSIKSLKQSENLKKAQPKLNKLEKKYAGKNDQESMMMKSNEMMAIYKEYQIKPLSGCLLVFIQLPLFLAFYEALNRLPILFEGEFLGLHMGMTPIAAINGGNYIYLVLPILVLLVTYFSMKMNKNQMQGDQAKQMNTMFNIMIIMIFFTSFSMSTSIIMYWITNSLFTIVQNLLVKRSK